MSLFLPLYLICGLTLHVTLHHFTSQDILCLADFFATSQTHKSIKTTVRLLDRQKNIVTLQPTEVFHALLSITRPCSKHIFASNLYHISLMTSIIMSLNTDKNAWLINCSITICFGSTWKLCLGKTCWHI